MNTPLISVIVPAYNIEKYIGKCLDSILNQTYRNLEIIVVDDGSKDDTGVIIDGYSKKDNRFRIIHQENRGLSGARNSALMIATGEYIGYVDGDDSISPDMYEKMLNACIDNDAELAVCGYDCVDEDGFLLDEGSESSLHLSNPDDSQNAVHVLPRLEALKTYLSDDKPYHIYNSVWSKLFKRSIVEGIEFPEGHNSEDIMYTAKALVNCNTCVFVDAPLYHYVQSRPDSIMNVSEKLAERRFRDELPFWEEQIELFKASDLPEIAKLARYYLTRRELFYYVDFRDRKMKDAADHLARMLQDNKEIVLNNFNEMNGPKGDQLRLKTFMKSPGLYYVLNKLYEKTIVTIKKRA